MNSAEQLYRTLESFNQDEESGQTPEQLLRTYCTQVLGAVERIHFDFKEKRDRSTPQLDEADKKNLAKAVSGFANSAGGVLIWGIADNLQLRPISNVEQFLARLLELAPAATVPQVPAIDGFFIRTDGDRAAGYAILIIPESSLPPHRVILKIADIQNHYYIRSGSAFSVAPHVHLEDMFGRRPRPVLAFNHRITMRHPNPDRPELLIFLGIVNRGRGAAKAPYLSLTVHPPNHLWRYGIDGNGNFGLNELIVATHIRERRFGGTADTVIHSGIEHDVAAIKVEIYMRASTIPDIVVDCMIAADGVMPLQSQLHISGDELRQFALKALAQEQ